MDISILSNDTNQKRISLNLHKKITAVQIRTYQNLNSSWMRRWVRTFFIFFAESLESPDHSVSS